MKKLIIVCALCLISFIFSGCEKAKNIIGGDVAVVKNGVLGFDKSLTVGQAIDNYKYFNKTEWNAEKTENGKRIVNVNCVIDNEKHPKFNSQQIPNLKKAEMKFQFVINQDNTFELAWCGFAAEKTSGEKISPDQSVNLILCINTMKAIYNNSPDL